ncbi:hypothetical protein H8959_019416 [Pygathrix nigripes]
MMTEVEKSTRPYKIFNDCRESGLSFSARLAILGPFPNMLREVEVEIISYDICNQVHVYGGAVSSGMICAGFLSGKLDACKGDSGGPLVIARDRNAWYLVGIPMLPDKAADAPVET